MSNYTMRQRAKALRKNSTNSEKHLWYNLRANRLGFKFKRQVPIGTYIVDFVCLEKRLIIELDGGQHLDNQNYDKERTAWLQDHGFRVLRFWNNDVLQQTAVVVDVILGALTDTKVKGENDLNLHVQKHQTAPSPQPSPAKENISLSEFPSRERGQILPRF